MTDPVARLDLNAHELSALINTAGRLRRAGRRDSAAAYAQAAGLFAWLNPTGLFASLDLEELLADLGTSMPPTPRTAVSSTSVDVLHVATQAFQTGGHTQAIACWLDQDTGRRHRICLTRQGTTAIPPKLAQRLGSHDDLVRLDLGRGGLVRRAGRLRDLARHADVVVLHTHPYDVVPVMAFAAGGPPVVNVNHADHVFWLGTSVTSSLMNLRGSGQALAISRRGIDPKRSIIVPRPLSPRRRTMNRDEAKRELGLAPSDVLLVTAADGSKYRRIRGEAFLDLLVPFVASNPDVVLLAAGPSAETDKDWHDAWARSGGRIRALGHIPDVTPLHQAADIYLDSFPFSSLTSLLEAGWYGTPVVTYRGHPDDCLVLGADTEGVDDVMVRPRTPEEFTNALTSLIHDADERADLGAATARAIESSHTGDGWRRSVDDLFTFAADHTGIPTVSPPVRETGELDILLQQLMERTGWYRAGAPGAIVNNLGLLPVRDRARAWWDCARAGDTPPPRLLVPEWLRPRLERLRPGGR